MYRKNQHSDRMPYSLVLLLMENSQDSSPQRSFVRSSGQILLPRYLTNAQKYFNKTDRKYSTAPTDDLNTSD